MPKSKQPPNTDNAKITARTTIAVQGARVLNFKNTALKTSQFASFASCGARRKHC